MTNIIKIYNEGCNSWEYKYLDELQGGRMYLLPKKDYHECSLPDFIVDIEGVYKTIPTLEKSDEYNNAFESWLLKNTAVIKSSDDTGNLVYCTENEEEELITEPQMLLGYHIEFIKESIK